MNDLLVVDELFEKTGDLLAIDPGEMSGFAWMTKKNGKVEVISAGQTELKKFVDQLFLAINTFNERGFRILCEDYRIRKNTVPANLNKDLKTVKEIGIIQWICRFFGLDFTSQPAGIGNAFFDRKRMEEMGVWVVGKRHARDAIRHGLWHLTFGKEE